MQGSSSEGCQNQHIPVLWCSPLSRSQNAGKKHRVQGTRATTPNSLLMENFPYKIQEKEFIGRPIWPGCTSFLFHTTLVEPSARSARTCHFYPLSREFQTPQSILKGARGQESHGRVSCISLHAAEQMPGITIPSGADTAIGAKGRGAAVWASACWRCS